MPGLPVDIPPADEASPHTAASYGGVSNAEANIPAAYQSPGAVDAEAQPPKNGRRTGALAAAAALAAMALVVAGVVTGSQTNAAANIMGTGNALAEKVASAAKIAKVAADAADGPGGHTQEDEQEPSPPHTATDYTGFHVMFILVDDMGKPHTRKTRKTKTHSRAYRHTVAHTHAHVWIRTASLTPHPSHRIPHTFSLLLLLLARLIRLQ